ncbi:MAG: adenosylcobinamide-GDP ribazoletransferase [Firmicutes bacterium]|nr:adenosylcobinamide-GDP ribazoletransferase [Bacillota bacterium]
MTDDIRYFFHDLALALQFLTRLPVPLRTAPDPERLAGSVKFYPFAGALIGVILAVAHATASRFLPPLVSAAVTVAAWATLTGAMHLDGLMDAADGLLSHRGRGESLEIMKDSRVGAMGVVAGLLVLLVKFSALASVPAGPRSVGLLSAVVAGRISIVCCLILFPYAREQGMGAFSRGLAPLPAVAGVLGGAAIAFGSAGAIALLTITGAATVGFLAAASANRALGGLTGDVYGAVCEITEAVALILWVALI